MKKQPISHKVLRSELSFVIDMFNNHNYGVAKEMVFHILERVKEYDIARSAKKKKQNNANT